MGRVDLLIQNWFHRKSKGRQCKGRWPRNFDFFQLILNAHCPERGCRPSPRRQRRIASSVLQLQSGLRSVACGSTLRTTPAPCTASIANPTQLSNPPFASSYYYRTDERWSRYPSNSQRTAIHANPDWPYAERQITRKWKCGGDCMSD